MNDRLKKMATAIWPNKNTHRIFMRFLSEFSFPFVLAGLWTWWDWTKNPADYDWLGKLPLHFFAVGWVFQQWNRIKKQKRSEDGMANIETSVQTLITSLEDSTRQMIGHSTGGDSFIELIPTPTTLLFPSSFALMHHGDYALFDVQVRIVDLDRIERVGESIAKFENTYEFNILIPQHLVTIALKQTPVDRIGSAIKRFNVYVTARNGTTEQMLKLAVVNGLLRTATSIDRKGKVIFEDAAPDFPRDASGTINWESHYMNRRFDLKKDLQ